MNQSSDESTIRELLARVKRADQRDTPEFDELLSRQKRTSHQSSRGLQIAAIGCAVTLVLVAMFYIRSQQKSIVDAGPYDHPMVGHETQSINAPPGSTTNRVVEVDRVTEIDFDHLRRVVDDHFRSQELTQAVRVSVWSSHTESLLALNLDVSSYTGVDDDIEYAN